MTPGVYNCFLDTQVNVKKTFFSSLMKKQNKLEHLFLASLFSLL
jgi:hypothetical protein